ncbi:MAG: hypothetical protein OXT70_03675 [Chloroflexota bacterium]|nr:hypothetical protein [Chloroflexota bacterium]
MATMNPILRLRQAFRSMGAESERADEAADAIDSHSYSRHESDLRHHQMMTEVRQYMAETRNQILLGTLLIAGILGTILPIAIAVFD